MNKGPVEKGKGKDHLRYRERKTARPRSKAHVKKYWGAYSKQKKKDDGSRKEQRKKGAKK